MKQRIAFFALATLVGVSSAASAQSCQPSTQMDIPAFEKAKTAFLHADYRAFSDVVGAYIPGVDENYDAFFGPLAQFGADGYDRCQTILQRREAPGFYQEVVLYFPKGWESPLAVHIVGAEVDGEVKVLEFSYNTSISDVLSGMH